MLNNALRENANKLGFLTRLDSEKLLFDDNTFDAVVVSFGVRNFEDLSKGLTDMCRVTKEGGTCVVIELSTPKKFPMKQLYRFYSSTVLPFIGKLISKDNAAYTYLPESVKAFPDGEEFLSIFRAAGFKHAYCKALTFGICSIYVGKK
ncbi:UNVERIFIED_CONTAM: hypothetical protein GTU68_007904 [Idotea baltica]|nr:hypothetical protein [Idotea baltica]